MIKYKLYRLKWFLAPYISFRNPVHIDIELNNTCNQKCISCWHSQKKLPFEKMTMEINDAYSIISEAHKFNIKSIKFNLRGEPSAYQPLDKIALYAKNKFVDLMINTNGIMSENKFKTILDCFNTIIISVDSFVEKTYCKLHGATKKQFNILKRNIEYLYNNYKSYKRKRIKFNIHLNQLNQDENFAIYRVIYYMFPFIFRKTENREGSHIAIEPKKRKRKKNCPHMMRRLTILSNLKIYPCCVCYNEPEDICIGHFNLDTLEQVWNGELRKNLIKNYRKGIYTETCKNCTSGDIWKI